MALLVLAHVAIFSAATLSLRAAPGDLDPLDAGIGGGNGVYATAVQPDGKIVIAGEFTSVLGVPRRNIARLNSDGTLDMGFDPNVYGGINSVAVQANGKVLIGGQFLQLQPNGAASPTLRFGIARVNPNGTLDTGFDPKPNNAPYVPEVYGLALQPDGKVLLAGRFTTLQPNGAAASTPRQSIARVNADGTLDMDFDPRPNYDVHCVALQPDGKVLLGGIFTTLQPNGAASSTPRQYIARVNADGTLDSGFDPKADSSIYCVTVQPDGKVLLGGTFTTLQPNGAASPTVRSRVARVNADGTLDTGFDPKANSWVFTVALQTDGKVLLGGNFAALQPNGAASPTTRQRIARVNADGTLDLSFDPRANQAVFCVALQADGKVLLGGYFTALQPNGASSSTSRQHFARLENDPATQALSAPSASVALWQRSGTAPELSRVTFELSSDGGDTWSSLGAGTRIGATPDWQLAGLTLPSTGYLRARGVTSGGQYNGSSGLVEQLAEFVFTPQISNNSTGVKPGGFGFTIIGVTNQTIVIEASTNLVNWQAIWTNTLSAISTNFVDPQWVNYPRGFYRLRSN
jgi:trimeric autotransporter adhesin